MRLAGLGIPSLQNKNRRGDLYFEVTIEIPKKLKKREEEKLRDLAEELGEDIVPPSHGLFGRKKRKKKEKKAIKGETTESTLWGLLLTWVKNTLNYVMCR